VIDPSRVLLGVLAPSPEQKYSCGRGLSMLRALSRRSSNQNSELRFRNDDRRLDVFFPGSLQYFPPCSDRRRIDLLRTLEAGVPFRLRRGRRGDKRAGSISISSRVFPNCSSVSPGNRRSHLRRWRRLISREAPGSDGGQKKES